MAGNEDTADPVSDHAPTGRARLRVQRVRPAYHQVADELRTQIMTGGLTPGARLPNETDLSKSFGVSRSTVREALRVLTSQHFVETLRGVRGGSFVASPDPIRVVEDIGGALGALVLTPKLGLNDLIEARLLLEPAAARLAAQRADPETIEAIRATMEPKEDRDLTSFVAHFDFHAAVLMATGNLMFLLMAQPIADVLRLRVEHMPAANDEWRQVDDCHATIAGHIERGEAAQAEAAMRLHLLELKPLYDRAGRTDPATGHRPAARGLARIDR